MSNVSKVACKWFELEKNLSKFDENFMQNYDEDSNKAYILEVHVEDPKDLHTLHYDLQFLSKRMRI